MEMNILETLKSSIVMMILLGCSMVALTFVIERWLYLKKAAANADGFLTHVRESLHHGGPHAAIAICSTSTSALAAVVRAGLENKGNGDQAVAEIMNAVAMDEQIKLEKNLNILGTLGNIAPLIGLFGTVVGIIHAFHAMALNGSAGPSVISAGIAEALLTTAAGLVVAVPAVVFYNTFLRRVNTIMSDIESAMKKVGVLLADKKPGPVTNGHLALPTAVVEVAR
jgi:biopolymer transport protein ExbB